MKKLENNKKGFTLVELLIAVGLFTIIAFISLGALLTIYDSHKKSQASKTVMDNFNISIENMVRMVRFGRNYHCEEVGILSEARDCSSNLPGNGSTFIAVTFYDTQLGRDKIVAYKYNPTNMSIEMSEDGGPFRAITSPDTKIEYLRFYVIGSSNLDAIQPYSVAVIKGYVGSKPNTRSTFSIQTMMSQRARDI